MILVSVLAAGVLIWLYRGGRLARNLFFLFFALNLCGAAVMTAELARPDGNRVTELSVSALDQEEGIALEVRTDSGEQYEVDINAPEQVYDVEEAEQLLTEACTALDEVVPGQNASLSHVEWNLTLPAELEGTPVRAEWYTDQPDILGFDGVIRAGVPADGVPVVVYAELSVQEQTMTYSRSVRVFPSREADTVRDEILYESDRINREYARQTGIYRLPEQAAGRQLRWFKGGQQNGFLYSVLALIGGLLGVIASREKKERAGQARQEEMLRDYPEIVSKIQLYLGAGLSMRNIFARIGREYGDRRSGGAPARQAYEEIQRAVRRMESGATELEAYDAFGRACAVPCYRSLALLIAQNQKKGGAGLMPLLEREVQEAFETRKRRARAEGEKTTVRLLLPMAMMLVVVMALILIPAFLSL